MESGLLGVTCARQDPVSVLAEILTRGPLFALYQYYLRLYLTGLLLRLW